MRWRWGLGCTALLSCLPVWGDVAAPEEECVATLDDVLFRQNRHAGKLVVSDVLPEEDFENANDVYLEAYIQALLDTYYYEHNVIVSVKNHRVYLYNLPKNAMIARSIVSFVKELPGVLEVHVEKEIPPEELEAREKYVEFPRVSGIWFPQSTVLFQPLVADPRQPQYSVAYRGADRVIGKVAAAVDLGDEFPIFRWRDVWWGRGDLQIGLEAGIFAVFSYVDIPPHESDESCELVNTDYWVGIPLSYAYNEWSYRLRLYHISSHLGDEFLVNHPEFIANRKNPSFEAIDLFTSYQISSNLRGYAGAGVVVHSDESFKLKPLYVEYGFELRLFGQRFEYHRLFGTPFLAIHTENWQQRHWDIDVTVMAGYELSKLQGVGRKLRMFAEYHAGFSYEGQFFNERVKYWEAGFYWGF